MRPNFIKRTKRKAAPGSSPEAAVVVYLPVLS